MGLLAFGINHRTASVDMRERLAFSPERVEAALLEAAQRAKLEEVAILSTCNRTEVYGSTQEPNSQFLLNWLGEFHKVGAGQIQQCAYEYWEYDAVRHLMRVASGLDSMVLGEPQILGQLKSAFTLAQQAKTVGPQLGRLFQQTFSVAKQVRTETSIGTNPVSVAFAAVSLAKHIFSDLASSSALLIGAGETVELVAKHLFEQGIRKITVANRTLARANALAEKFSGKAITLEEIPEALIKADIVISSTASPLPILGKGAVEHALRKRRHKPMFMMDIAVPRDIEEEVGELGDVYLYTVDDLQEVVAENRKQRMQAAAEAESIIERRTAQYMDALRGMDAVDTITRYRSKLDEIREQELEKALAMIKRGVAPDIVLDRMARTLTNKVMHQPTVQLKRAGEEGRTDKIEWAQSLFGLIQVNENNSEGAEDSSDPDGN